MGEPLEDEQDLDAGGGHDGSLKGTLTSVLIMAAFFAAAWLGMYALLLSRR